MTAEQIIGLWPSAAAMSRDIGVNPVNIRVWKYRKAIPPAYWPEIVIAAGRRGLKLSISDLAAAHRHDRGDAI